MTADSVVHKFTQDVGDGESNRFAVHHNLGARDVVVEVYDSATGENLMFRGMDVCGAGMHITYSTVDEVEVFWPCWVPGPGQARVVVLA